MTSVVHRSLTELGEPATWTSDDLIIVDDPRLLLYVEDGVVDVFAVQIERDRPTGAWTSQGRLRTGDFLVAPASGPRCRLVCRRVEGARVRTISMSELRSALALGPHLLDPVARGLDRASEMIIDQVRGDDLPPREFVVLEAGAETEVAAGRPARPLDRLVWVDVLAGSCRVSDSVRNEFHAGATPFAITKQDWLTASGTVRVRCRRTAQMLASGDYWPAAIQTQTLLLFAIDRAVETLRSEKLQRVRTAADQDGTTLRSLRDLNDRVTLGAHAQSQEWRLTEASHFGAVNYITATQRALPDIPAQLRPTLERAVSYDELSATGWVRTRRLHLEGEWWMQDVGPLVAQWGPDREPIALRFDDGGYLAIRAGDRPLRITRDNRHNAQRTAWVVTTPVPPSVASVPALLRFASTGGRPDLWRLALLTVPIALLGLVAPLLSGRILGTFVADADRPMIIQAGLAIVLVAFAVALLTMVQNLVVLRLVGRVSTSGQEALWDRVLRLPLPFFGKESAGRLASVVLGLKNAEDQLSSLVVTSLLGMVGVAAELVLLLILDPVLAVICVGFFLVVGLAALTFVRRALHRHRLRHALAEDLDGLTSELLTMVSKIRAAGAEYRALSRWAVAHREFHRQWLLARAEENRLQAMLACVPAVGLALVLVCAHVLHGGLPDLTTLLTFVLTFQLMSAAIVQLLSTMPQVLPLIPMLHAVEPLLQLPPESGPERAQPGDLSGRVALRNVSFRYGQDGPLVLDDLDLQIAPGEFVAIVGSSGSGKSTVLRLLLGFEQPDSGSVLYDGQDLSALDVAMVRRQCGVVLQNAMLSPGSVRENVIGPGNYSDSEVWDALEMAGLAQTVREMPMKLATMVADGGLSGGERQRLMIARALISRPRLVLFDEATSALDNPTQQLVADATRQLNAARLVVAHRLSTVQDADRIIVLEKGSVVQEGRYEELLAQADGAFAALAKGQRVGAHHD